MCVRERASLISIRWCQAHPAIRRFYRPCYSQILLLTVCPSARWLEAFHTLQSGVSLFISLSCQSLLLSYSHTCTACIALILVFYDKLQEHAKYEPEVIYGTSRLMTYKQTYKQEVQGAPGFMVQHNYCYPRSHAGWERG